MAIDDFSLSVASGGGGTGPTISGFSPSSGAEGSSVTISGSNFSSPTVKFNGTTATITASTATSITATVPTGATTGKITVEVAGQTTATSANDFTVSSANAPTITSITPATIFSGLGQSVTIAGSNFTGATSVTFNGVNAFSYTVNSATQITATPATAATTGPVTVTTANGSGSGSLTVVPLDSSETASGDYSNNTNAPTVLNLGTTTKLVAGTIAGEADYLTFTVPAGYLLNGLNLRYFSYTTDQVAFMAIDAGTTWTAGQNTTQMLGWTASHLRPSSLNTDLLTGMNVAGSYLPEGNYTVWIQQLGAGNTYVLEFELAAAPPLTLSLNPTAVNEDAGAAASTGTVGIPTALSNNLTVSLVSSNTAAATVPSTVTITNGQTNATFAIAAVANTNSLANQTAGITASASGYASAVATLTVNNTDVPAATFISLINTNANSYTQNFDSMGTNTYSNVVSATIGVQTSLGVAVNSALDGWYVAKVGGTGTSALPITASDGSANSGGIYNYGATNTTGNVNLNRSLGLLASGTTWGGAGALIKNNTGGTVTGLKLNLTGKFWRNATSTTNNLLTFGYGLVDGTTNTTTNFLTSTSNVRSLAGADVVCALLVATNIAVDGNLVANQVALSNVALPLTLTNGQTAFIRWQDFNDGGNDAGIAIDDFSLTAVSNSVAAPQFSLAGGVVLSNTNVKVSNYGGYTNGGVVYYTTDGSTPTSSSTVYNDTLGIALTAGNGPITLKALAVEGGVESLPATAIYDLPKDVADLTALRVSPTGSTLYRVTGPVTFTAGTTFRNTKFFQDSGAGIQIDDSTGIITTSYTAGDNLVNIAGRISFFGGQLQMQPVADFGAPVSSNNPVTPLSRTLTALTDADQAMLVTVSGVEYQGANGTLVFGGGGSNLAIRDGSTGVTYSGYFRNIFGESDITGKVVPANAVTLTGIVQKTTINSVQTLTVGARNSLEAGLPLALSLSSDVATLVEGAVEPAVGAVAAVAVTRSGPSTGDLVVTLRENVLGGLEVSTDFGDTYSALPADVTIPNGSPSLNLLVRATENSVQQTSAVLTAEASGFTAATQNYTITDNDGPANSAPTDIALSATSIAENNAVDATVGTLSTTDADSGESFTYSLVSGTGSTDNASFTIVGSALKAGVAFNFETKSSYSIRVRTTDSASNTFEKQFTITVTDVNEAPAGNTFAGWSGNATVTSELVGKYGIGGATNLTGASEKPVSAVDSNTLSLSAIVRTNDTNLTVLGEAGGSLTNWSTNGVSVTASTNTNGVPEGHQRKVFSVDRTNSPTRQFLRLKATLAP